MHMRRLLYTPLLTVLLWMVVLGFIGDPLFVMFRWDKVLALILGVILFLSTMVGVRAADLFFWWSYQNRSLFDAPTILAHLMIAFVTSLIFSYALTRVLSQKLDISIRYVDMFMSEGVLLLIIVWAATIAVDLLVEKPQTKN